MKETGVLHFFSGKMAAGKSTLAKKIVEAEDAILISEDAWLESLYKDEILTFEDYIKYSSRLKPLICRHVIELLNQGLTVVLDFPANTRKQRAWFLEIIDLGYSHQLHYVQASDELCLKQLAKRNKGKDKSAFATEAMFYEVTSYFEAPCTEEPFYLKIHSRESG